MDEIEVKCEKICRVCLSESNELRSIYRQGKVCDEITTLSDMLSECTSLEFHEDDGLPGCICMTCVLKLSRAYMFRQTCFKSNTILRAKLQPKASDQESEGEVVETIYYYDEAVDQQISQEDLEDDNMQNTITISDYDDSQEMRDDQKLIGIQETTMTEDGSEMTVSLEETVLRTEYEENTSASVEEKYDTESPTLVFRKRRNRAKKFSGPPFKCEICGKILSNYSSKKYHMQLHSDDAPYLCSDCGEKFKTRNAYEGHMSTHYNPHTCKLCGKSYRQAGSLKSHMLAHTGEKPFLCGICGKGMTQKSGFKKHMLTHTGEKPYECDVCRKKFRYSSNLITHKRCHSGDKPYVCTVCDKRFIGGEQLKRHSVVHTGEKPFKCEICEKYFNRKSSLSVHQNLHMNDKMHACQNYEKSLD